MTDTSVLSDRQLSVLLWIATFRDACGRTPSTNELAEHFETEAPNMFHTICTLERLGFIQRARNIGRLRRQISFVKEALR